MKKSVILVVSLFSCLFSFNAKSEVVQAQITSLTCASLYRNDTTNVTFTGSYEGQVYFNITNIGPFNFPVFTQQARVEEVKTIENGLSFKLHTMLMNTTVYLEIYQGGNHGLLSTYPGDQDGIKMMCQAEIKGI